MNIVVLDAQPLTPGDDGSWAPFAALGDLTVYNNSTPEEVISRARDADALLVNKVRLPAGILAALPRLRYVGVLATGYDVVDVQAAVAQGITVCNVVAYGTESVAQHAMALLMELCRGTGCHSQSVHSGEWNRRASWCYWLTPQVELSGKTLGIAGFGHNGRRMAELARAFGMTIIAHSRSCADAPDWPGFAFVNRETLFRESHVLSLHCPLFPETEGMVNAETLKLMPAGAMIVNTARGPLVNEADVAAALRSGRLAGYATDVLSVEPPAPDNPLLGVPNAVITPHLAWASLTARQNIMNIAASNLKAFLNGTPQSVVGKK